jgi:hypothetical protein
MLHVKLDDTVNITKINGYVYYALRIFLTQPEYENILKLINTFTDEKFKSALTNSITELYMEIEDKSPIPDTIKAKGIGKGTGNYTRVLRSNNNDCFPFSDEKEKKLSFNKLTLKTYDLLPPYIKGLYRTCYFSFYPKCIK